MTDWRPTKISSYNGEMRGSVPNWVARPGALEAIAPAASAMNLWLSIRSINGIENKPCFASARTLAELLCVSRSTVQNRLKILKSVPGLLFEIPRGYDPNTQRLRTHARWATDPLESESFRKTLAGYRLAQIADDVGLGTRWLEEALRNLNGHVRMAEALGERMREDLEEPCADSTQYAVGVVGRGRRRSKRKRGKRGGTKKGRRAAESGEMGGSEETKKNASPENEIELRIGKRKKGVAGGERWVVSRGEHSCR